MRTGPFALGSSLLFCLVAAACGPSGGTGDDTPGDDAVEPNNKETAAPVD